MTLGKKIKLLLELNGKTQRLLAEYCQVSVSTVNRWCNDKTPPNFYDVPFICTFLNCSITDLYSVNNAFSQLLEKYDEGLIK